MVRLISLLFAILVFGAPVSATSVSAPDISTNSVWVFRVVDASSGRSVSLFSVLIEEKSESGYGVLRSGIQDASSARYKITRNLGQGSPVSSGKQGDGKLYDFPLVDGKKWKSQSFWVNGLGESGQDDVTYTVMGQQPLATSAGRFLVVRVSGVGVWKNHITNETGSLNVTLYYAPDAQTTVRSERITGSANFMEKAEKNIFELVYFKLGATAK